MTGFDRLKDWIGRTQVASDIVAADRVAMMAATLDRASPPGSGTALPLGWHWMFFNPTARASELGPDGHPKRGGFLPPVPLPRRMWAGGRLNFVAPLKVGEEIRRESKIDNVTVKHGRSGTLVFVVVKHRVSGSQGLAVEEEHDIVYREAARPDAPAPVPDPAPSDAVWRREIVPDPVLLFRYSALTFNGHRIHYDHPYVTKTEGYPGLIVHGPLIATLLLELLSAHVLAAAVRSFAFRAAGPLFDTAPFTLNGRTEADQAGARLWAAGPRGELAMSATAVIRR